MRYDSPFPLDLSAHSFVTPFLVNVVVSFSNSVVFHYQLAIILSYFRPPPKHVFASLDDLTCIELWPAIIGFEPQGLRKPVASRVI